MKVFFSLLTIFGVTSLVSMIFVFVVQASIVDGHSNIYYANVALHDISTSLVAMAKQKEDDIGSQIVLPAVIPVASESAKPLAACPTASELRNIRTYLQSRNLPSTYEYRKELAVIYDIENYKGTSEQNMTLLKMMLTDDEGIKHCTLSFAQSE